MSHEVETMAYVGEVPWHGLGVKLASNLPPAAMLKAASLDWTVSKRPIFIPTNNAFKADENLEAYLKAGGKTQRVEDFSILTRDSDNKAFGPCGKDYIPTQNKEAFSFFKKFSEAGKMTMEAGGSLQGGRMIWALAAINESFVLPGKDEVRGYLLLCSPHVWGKSLTIRFTSIRVVCMNTLTRAMYGSVKGSGFRMPHIRAFDTTVAEEALQTVEAARLLFKDVEQEAKKMAKARISEDVKVRYIADIFQPSAVTEVFGDGFKKLSREKQAHLLLADDSPSIDPSTFNRVASDVLNRVNQQPGADMRSARGTVWGAFNGVTNYLDFFSGRLRDNAVYSAWFGPKSALKNKALTRGLDIAAAASSR